MTRNNTLDIAEFAIAMHLIQSRLKGTDIPEKLPETLAPVYLPTVNIPAMSAEEKGVYEKAFMWNVNSKTGFIDGKHYCMVSWISTSVMMLEVRCKVLRFRAVLV